MRKVWLILFLITNFFYTTLSAEEKTKAYINITSNAQDTLILLDGRNIGHTPIKQYQVTPNKKIKLKAIVDKDYYEKDITMDIEVNGKTIPTYNLKFEKAKAKIFFIGDDAEVYINGKFIQRVLDTNRVITVDAGEAIRINLIDGYARAELFEDIKANTLNNVEYVLIEIPKEVRLYTSTINNLMWEDTKDAVNKDITWEKAYTYCATLKIADYEDFRLPTIDELHELYENKDEIYNGFGGKFYWSDTTFKGETKIWDYSVVKDFNDGTNKKSIKEFEKGRVRCVRDL